MLLVRSPRRWADSTTSTQVAVGSLPLGQNPSHLVVEDLGRRSGQRAETGFRQLGKEVGDAARPHARPRRRHLHGAERVHVKIRQCLTQSGHQVDVVRRPVAAGSIPPCRQTSVAPRSHASDARCDDLLDRELVGVSVRAPLSKRAEPAAGVADVGEVDVAVDDERHARRLRRPCARRRRGRPPPRGRNRVP